MARQCPQCHTRIPAGCAVAYTDGFECPNEKCQAWLVVSNASRYLAITAGLVAAVALAWWMGAPEPGLLDWAAPVLYIFLAFSVVAMLATALLADLVVGERTPAPAAEEAHGHSAAPH